MVEIIKKSFWVSLLVSSFVVHAQTKLVDQSIAVVDKQVITLRDVQARMFVSEGYSPSDHQNLDKIQKTRETFVEEVIVDTYFQSGQLKKLEQSPKVNALSAQQKRDLRGLNLSEDLVLKMLRLRSQKDLFIESFISLRTNIRPGELESFYESRKKDSYAGKTFSSITKTVESDLKSFKLRDEYKKWRDSQIIRSNVIFLPLPNQL